VWSNAVMGASRWLDANRLAGASMNSAMPKAMIDFSFFIGMPLFAGFVDIAMD
jgi:hypothetical protein